MNEYLIEGDNVGIIHLDFRRKRLNQMLLRIIVRKELILMTYQLVKGYFMFYSLREVYVTLRKALTLTQNCLQYLLFLSSYSSQK